MAASCIYECRMASHSGEGVNQNGTQLLSVALLAVTVNIWVFVTHIYSCLIFGSFLFLLGAVSRRPCAVWTVAISRGPHTSWLIDFHGLIVQWIWFSVNIFFYFNCISFGYIWLPGGCLVASWWLPGGILVTSWWLHMGYICCQEWTMVPKG